MFIEINLRKKKWLLSCSYNPHRSKIVNHLNEIGRHLDSYSSKYDNYILMGDFNVEPTEHAMAEFMQTYDLRNLVKGPTCFKNPENPSCIDLILTNRNRSFQGSYLIETGISDFHKMTLTVMKSYFKKQEPKILTYRDYKNFSNEKLRHDLKSDLSRGNIDISQLEIFIECILNILNTMAPIKKRSVRSNQAPFMNKNLKKAFMTRSRMRNNFLKNKTKENKEIYNKQRNYCVSLVRKEKKNFYQNIDTSKITDNKTFWKTVKPLFSNKTISSDKMTLIKDDNIISENKDIAEIFNKFFANIVKDMNITMDQTYISTDQKTTNNANETEDTVISAIERYKNHPSILAISAKSNKFIFTFRDVTFEEIENELTKLDLQKASQDTDIPTKIIKQNSDIIGHFIYRNFNNAIACSVFPVNLKNANITPIHKKDSRETVSNYRPVSILPNLSKIYEKCMYKQISKFFENILSKYQCGFRKGFSSQQCLLVMLEKWRKSLDKGGNFGALLTDLSKAFDCLPHDLLIAKLHAYGFDIKSLNMMNSYLRGRKQRVKVCDSYSTWQEILFGVPQGSILGPLLFNIFICDLFLFVTDTDIASYADDNTPYVSAHEPQEVINKLESISANMFKWFKHNGMKANADKCHLLLSAQKGLAANIGEVLIKSSDSEKLLGVTIDNKLNFEKHINNLCDKASQKLNALARMSSYMDLPKRRLIMKAFINSQFGYCPLIWMNHSRTLNSKINRIQERALRIVYNDRTSTFSELLTKDNSVTVHSRNLQVLATEMYKVRNGLAPEIVNNIFQPNTSGYDLRNSDFKTENVRTVHYGTETLSFLGPNIWRILPPEMKNSTSLQIFKNKIKSWSPENCPCRLCKQYIQGVGFI